MKTYSTRVRHVNANPAKYGTHSWNFYSVVNKKGAVGTLISLLKMESSVLSWYHKKSRS